MTYFQLFCLIIGIGFILTGTQMFKKAKFWSSIALLIGIWLMNQVLFGEISKSDDKQKEIRELKFDSIVTISILPSQRREVLTAETLQITSKVDIKRIQESLSKTTETLKTNQIEDWDCILSVQRVNQEDITAGISKKDNQTILELYSEGEYGTNYGTMINNELGFILEDLIKRNKASR